MMPKASFAQKENEFSRAYHWALRENMGIALLLAVLLFLVFPMMIMIRQLYTQQTTTASENLKAAAQGYASYLWFTIPIFGVTFLLLFAVIFAVRLFRYMQDSHSVDLFHALPLGRVPLVLGRWCAGMTVLAVPPAVNFLILQAIAWAGGFPAVVGAVAPIDTYTSTNVMTGGYAVGGWLLPSLAERPMNLWRVYGFLIAMAAAAFTCCVFAMVCSGSVMDAVISTLGVNLGCPLFFLLCMELMKMTPGVDPLASVNSGFLLFAAPFLAAYQPFWGTAPKQFVPWWLCFTAFLLAGACLLYRRRGSEAAGNRFAFPAPKLVVRFLLTACGGLGLGLLIQNCGGGFWIGLLVGSAVTHVVLEALYSRGFDTLKSSAKGYAVFAVFFAVFYGVLATGCFGYDTRIPDASEVKSVEVNVAGIAPQYGQQSVRTKDGTFVSLLPVLKQPTSVQAVLQAHKNLVSWCRDREFPYSPQNSSYEEYTLTYRLKSGRSLKRSFSGRTPSGDAGWQVFSRSLNSIEQLPEYRQGNDVIFYLQPEDISKVTIDLASTGKSVELSMAGSDDAKELMEAIRKEYDDSFSSFESETQKDSLRLGWREGIAASGRLSEALGGYTGKVEVPQSSYEYRKGGEVEKTLRKIGGDQLMQDLGG